jgi:hypothetical protein
MYQERHGIIFNQHYAGHGQRPESSAISEPQREPSMAFSGPMAWSRISDRMWPSAEIEKAKRSVNQTQAWRLDLKEQTENHFIC